MTRIVKILSCIVFLSFFACLGARAQTTINASSCSESDVSSALRKVSSGSVTVTIPSGTCAWTSQLSYKVPSGVTNLTIQGATVVACTGTAGTSSYSCIATDNTVIQDAYQSHNSPIVIATGDASSHFRMTGLTIEGGNIGSTSYSKYNGELSFSGSSKNFRVDHCHFNSNTYSPQYSGIIMVQINGPIEGVFDHDVLDLGTQGGYNNGIRVFNDLFDTIGYGDGGFAAPTDWGSSHFIFLESSVVNGAYPNDCAVAGRMVERYDSFIDTNNAMEAHPTKQAAGRSRGCRAEAFYHNYISGQKGLGTYAALGGQGGTWLVWGNTLASASVSVFWAGETMRNTTAASETAPPTSWGYCGTAVANNGVGSPWDGNENTSTGYPCLDGLGRGQTVDALNGQNFPNAGLASTGSPGWPHQYLEPIYLFMNKLPPGLGYEVYMQDRVTQNNRDYYFDCGSYNSSCSGGFTGAAGTGYGSVPPTDPSAYTGAPDCTAGPGGTYGQSPTGSYGVAYFDTAANNKRGELYVCTSTNTWTPVYEPYIYPHPLVTENASSNTPDPPDSLSAAAH